MTTIEKLRFELETLKEWQEDLAFETEVLNGCKQDVKDDNSLGNGRYLREARDHVAIIKDAIVESNQRIAEIWSELGEPVAMLH